jgi:small-conductance mechanosensitive channel
MENISKWLHTYLGVDLLAQQKLIISVLIVVALWLLHRIFRASVTKRIQDLERRYQWQKGVGYILTTLGVIAVSLVWAEGMQYAATYLGLVSAGLAIALKDPITNIVAWIFILWRKPFEVGDRIEIGQYAGDVVDQRIFQFSMMEIGNWVDSDQSTGRILHIPNGMIFTSGVANYTHGPDYIWNEIPILITFESDWEKAKGLLQEIADAHDVSKNENVAKEFEAATRKFLLRYNKLTPIVYTNVLDSGVLLTIRYLCKPRQRRGTTEAIWEETLRAFAKHTDIDLAYPTTRFYSLEKSEG